MLILCFISFIAAERGTAHYEEEQFLSKVFIWVATIFLAWLVFVY